MSQEISSGISFNGHKVPLQIWPEIETNPSVDRVHGVCINCGALLCRDFLSDNPGHFQLDAFLEKVLDYFQDDKMCKGVRSSTTT